MKETSNKQKYYSVAELAKLIGISRVAIFNRIKKGQIPAERIGRSYFISHEDVQRILNKADVSVLTEHDKEDIKKTVKMVVSEYGETLRLLGKE